MTFQPIVPLSGIAGFLYIERTQDAQVDGVIRSYETAARMQNVAPNVIDISAETEETQALYGLERKETADFGHRCLLAQ